MDGSDGTAAFLADKEPRYVFSRLVGSSGRATVWAGIFRRGKTPQVVVEENLNFNKYCNLLKLISLQFTTKITHPGTSEK